MPGKGPLVNIMNHLHVPLERQRKIVGKYPASYQNNEEFKHDYFYTATFGRYRMTPQ